MNSINTKRDNMKNIMKKIQNKEDNIKKLERYILNEKYSIKKLEKKLYNLCNHSDIIKYVYYSERIEIVYTCNICKKDFHNDIDEKNIIKTEYMN